MPALGRDKQIRDLSEETVFGLSAADIQSKIAEMDARALLIIKAMDPSLPPVAIPADSLIEASKAHIDDLQSAVGCEVVYRADFALPPERVNCSLLPEIIARVQKSRDDFEARELAALSALEAQLTAQKEQVDAQSKTIADRFAANEKELTAVRPAMKPCNPLLRISEPM
jgi:hypothetical protein